MFKVTLVFVAIVCVYGREILERTRRGGGATDFDEPFEITCDERETISHVYSTHDNKYEDRAWYFGCCKTHLEKTGPCAYSDEVNEFDGDMNYTCPDNGYMSGVKSVHNNGYEDRIFQFRCCPLQGYHVADCEWSVENEWDGVLAYPVPNGKTWIGVTSHHDNGKEDRKFSFLSCRISRC